MTITLYKNNTSLASYTNALFEEKMKAVSRALVSSVSYLQTQVQTVKTDATSVASALSTIESIQQSLNALETKCEDALTQMENIAVSYGNTWYGSLASDPTENPWDNGPLMIGARYYNTTDKIIRIYTANGWQDYDASDEQIQLEVASIYAKILTAQQTVTTAEQNTVTAANSIITPIKQFETLFPSPMVAGSVPVVNSEGTGFGFIKSQELGVTAWNSTVANNGGYAQYSVVCDPQLPGMLYESNVSSNSQKPSLTSTQWCLFSTTPFVNVTSFGVVNDPTGDNVASNTQRYLLALQQCAGQYCLVHPVGLTVVISGLSLQQDDIQWRLDGTIILNNGENTDVIALTGGIQNFYLFGNGTINGSLLGNQNTNGQGSSTALGSCISVNALTTDMTSSQPLTHNIVVEGLTLKNAQYAFYGNNCNDSTVRKCRALQTTYGIIFSNGNGNAVEDCISEWNGQLGIGINNTAYNTSIRTCRVNSNWNQALNVYADGTQKPPQFCIIENNFVRDNMTNGVNIVVPTPSQTSTTAVLSSSDAVVNPIIDLKIMNNVFQNNARSGVGNDVTANSVNELLLSGNLFDRCANGYQGSLSSSPNAVWVNSSCSDVDIHSNTFKNVGSAQNPGIQLWLNYPTNGAVHSNTFMDTMGVTENWWGGGIDGSNTIDYNVTVGSLTSSASNIAILATNIGEQQVIPYFYLQGYTTTSPSSTNNNQAQCIWEFTNFSFSEEDGTSRSSSLYTWQSLLGAQATVTSGNSTQIQNLFGSGYDLYSIEPPILTITSIQVNGVDIPLDSTSSSVSLADLSTIQCVSSQSGKGWQILTSSGNLIYSLGESTGEFEPGFCPPESVFITFEIIANNTVDPTTVPTVSTTSTLATSTGMGTSSTSSSDAGESMTVYGGDFWNIPITCQIGTYLQTVSTLLTTAPESKNNTDEDTGPVLSSILSYPPENVYVIESDSWGTQGNIMFPPTVSSGLEVGDIFGVSKTCVDGWSGTIASNFSKSYSQYSLSSPTFTLNYLIVNGKKIKGTLSSWAVSEGNTSTSLDALFGISFNLQGEINGNWPADYFIVSSDGSFEWIMVYNGDWNGSYEQYTPPSVILNFTLAQNSLIEGTATCGVFQYYNSEATLYASNYWNTPFTVQLSVPAATAAKALKSLIV